MEQAPHQDMHYTVGARRDPVVWLTFLFGVVFACAGWTIDPASNCSEDGLECAPWLVHVARLIGSFLTLSAVIALIKNPSRGSRIDADTGELVWWHHSVTRGRIHPSAIGVIRIHRDSEGVALSLYDANGEKQLGFDDTVIAKPVEKWAERMVATWPHIRLEIR